MEWQIVVALVIAVPVVLFPAAFVWYLNLGGIYATIKEARAKRVADKKGARVKAIAKQPRYLKLGLNTEKEDKNDAVRINHSVGDSNTSYSLPCRFRVVSERQWSFNSVEGEQGEKKASQSL